MDLFSHALLPYLLGSFFKRRKEEVTAFVLGGIAPDFDVFILGINYLYPTFFLIAHRGITHSLFFGFFSAIAVLYLVSHAKVKTKVRRLIDFEPMTGIRAVWFAYAGVIIHLFLDYLTTRGIPLFYPLVTARYSAEIFFYTDICLTIASLIIIIFLYKNPLQKNGTKFLIVFLIIFAVLGSLRISEKNGAENFFQGAETKVYPTMNPFDWYVLGEEGDKIKIYEYNGLTRTSQYSETVSRLNILSEGESPETALNAAGELPQVKMFKWRAYAVAINASFNNGAWLLEYYDPIQRAEMKDAPEIIKKAGWTSIKVRVEGGKAVIS